MFCATTKTSNENFEAAVSAFKYKLVYNYHKSERLVLEKLNSNLHF